MDMAFNMGVPRLCKFKRMWAAIYDGDYTTAAVEMLDSRWATQVGTRAIKLSKAMEEGKFPND
jgi:lysozyme